MISRSLLLGAALALSASVAACQGCGPAQSAQPPAPSKWSKPTVRIYALSTVAGALEPCGCSKDQLGGADHLAALLASEQAAAPDRLVVGAGPLFFLSPTLEAERRAQDEWKAEALAAFAKQIGLAAWVPGANDWAAGGDKLSKWVTASGAAVPAANLAGMGGAVKVVVREVGGIKVALLGVADVRDRAGKPPEGVTIEPAGPALAAALAEAKQKGARVFVGLSSLPRGEALRLVEATPGLHLMVLGKPLESGDQNDKPKAAELVGKTLVVEGANHLQSVAVVDLFIDPASTGDLVFEDGSGLSRAEEALTLGARIRDLEARINGWEQNPKANKRDIEARRSELQELRSKKASLEVPPTRPEATHFHYKLVEVRDGLGSEPAAREAMRAFYKRVNEHNKTAFADRVPPPVEEGKAGYIGVEGACSGCHPKEREVWDKTAHAHAYATLEKDFKEFNLECTSCHVTGYGKPGGSTVTHVEGRKNVQCEECHGPASLHAKKPKEKGLITVRPDAQMCVTACHHPPHVEGFDANAKMELVLGPGHGR